MERIVESCRLAVNLLLATILYQIPIGVTAILTFKCSTTVTVRTDSCWYFDCSVGTILFLELVKRN